MGWGCVFIGRVKFEFVLIVVFLRVLGYGGGLGFSCLVILVG